MIRRLLVNLWFWVIAAFVLIIAAWIITIMIAKAHHNQPLREGEVLERQVPENTE